MGSCAHQITNSGLDISDVVILSPLSVIVVEVESDVLPGLEDVINDKTLGKVGVEVVLDCLCLANWSVVVVSVVAFEGDLAVGVRFAENVQISKVPSTDKDLYLLRFTTVQFHLIIII